MRGVALLLAAAACYTNVPTPDDGIGSGSNCAAFLPVCANPNGSALRLETGFDTTTSDLCTYPLAPLSSSCVVSAGSITVAGQVRVTGAAALILVANTSVTIQQGATLSASSIRGVVTGPGMPAQSCVPGRASVHSGGGAGGGFGTAGGAGGDGNNGTTGGVGGPMLSNTTMALAAGCPGTNGNPSAGLGSAANGGSGGGTLYIFAVGDITVSGALTADGAAGGGGLDLQGGGGGGTGGLLYLETFGSVTVDGVVEAVGGGGGGGGALTSPGNDGKGSGGGVPAAGCDGAGGDGARGTGTGASGAFGTSECGGGGGGGGAGVIVVRAPSGTVAGNAPEPPPTLIPSK